MRVVERLDKFDILGPKTIAVHCVHIDVHELDLLKASQTQVVHKPRIKYGERCRSDACS